MQHIHHESVECSGCIQKGFDSGLEAGREERSDINELLNEATARDDDVLWVAFNAKLTPFSIHIGPEPEFSQDEGVVQINLHSLSHVAADGFASDNLIVTIFDEGGDARTGGWR